MSTIIHSSPLPDVAIPEVSITDCVFASAAEHADEVAVTDGDASSYTFSQLHGAVRSLGGGLSSHGVGPGTTVESWRRTSRVRHRLPWHRAGWRDGHHHQSHLPTRGGGLPAPGRGSVAAGDHSDVPRDRPGGRRGHRGGGDRGHGRGRRRDAVVIVVRRAHRPSTGRLCGARGRAALLVGHHRSAQRGDAHPPQPGRQHRSNGTHLHPAQGEVAWPCCRSSTSTGCRC